MVSQIEIITVKNRQISWFIPDPLRKQKLVKNIQPKECQMAALPIGHVKELVGLYPIARFDRGILAHGLLC